MTLLSLQRRGRAMWLLLPTLIILAALLIARERSLPVRGEPVTREEIQPQFDAVMLELNALRAEVRLLRTELRGVR